MPIHCKSTPFNSVPHRCNASHFLSIPLPRVPAPVPASPFRFRASCCHPSPRPAPLCLSRPVLCPVIASPCRALPQPRPSWPCSSFAHTSTLIYTFPWRVSASLIHGHAPLAELILRSAFPCGSFAMQCLSVPSRIEAVQIRLPSPPAESPRPNAAANRGCALPLRPGGASHRSSRISYVNRPLPLFRHCPNPRSRP